MCLWLCVGLLSLQFLHVGRGAHLSQCSTQCSSSCISEQLPFGLIHHNMMFSGCNEMGANMYVTQLHHVLMEGEVVWAVDEPLVTH